MPSSSIKNLKTRRQVVKKLGVMGAYLPALALLGCSSKDGNDSDNSNTAPDSTLIPEGGKLPWANGGTDAISADYPKDNIFESTSNCTVELTRQTTLGPCYYHVPEREDISEGLQGLPMQLCLQVVDSSCNPVAGVTVEVWHCDERGVYSANSAESSDANGFNTSFCSGGDQAALSNSWYRGELVTDNSGRVDFKSCLPGWYPIRPIHIHFRVRNNGLDSSISQFGFRDAFATEIYTSHPHYQTRGDQDTPLEDGDFIFGQNYQDLLMNIQQNKDGSLLAYKRIQIAG